MNYEMAALISGVDSQASWGRMELRLVNAMLQERISPSESEVGEWIDRLDYVSWLANDGICTLANVDHDEAQQVVQKCERLAGATEMLAIEVEEAGSRSANLMRPS